MKTIYRETDPHTGLVSAIETDGKVMREVTYSDPAATRATLDRLQQARSDDGYAKAGIKAGWQHAGTIPAEVWLQWKNEGFDIFAASTAEIIKKLRDRDFEKLRATSGRI